MAQTLEELAQQKENLCGPFCVGRIMNLEQDLVARHAGTRADAPESEAGTSPAGLINAIESLSDGALTAVPVRGDWTADLVERFVEAATASDARLIANIRTGRLWGSRPSALLMLAELNGEELEGPPPDWDVGHFVELTMLVRGPRGSLVAVHDTYPSFGWQGHHLQPPRIVAAALRRGDGREGGILAVVTADQADGVEALARGLGLDVAAWDNGSRS
jgi:hypothetical protein